MIGSKELIFHIYTLIYISMDSENNQEQLETDSTVITEQSENKPTYEDLLKSSKHFQSELSKSNVKLSEYEKKGTDSDELKQKAENADKAEKIREEEGVFSTFKSDFTSLSEYQLKTIRDLQSMDTSKSFEDIAKSYGMLDEARIEKSKMNRQVMGNSIWVKSDKKETLILSTKAIRTHNIKSAEQLADIKSNYNL